MIRNYHKKQIDNYAWPYFNRILPQFENIEDEANKYSQDIFDDLCNNCPNPEDQDPSDFVAPASEAGLMHYEMLKLGLYTSTVCWHATLFEFFNQQNRLFLYKELSRYYEIQFNSFCMSFTDVKNIYNNSSVNIENISSWKKINELRLLCNVIKHSDGYSSKELRMIAPRLFLSDNTIDYLELYKTTLLEVTLNINRKTLCTYINAVKTFWDELPDKIEIKENA